MEYALLLYCKLPSNLETIRRIYDIHAKPPMKLPAHITLSYLMNDLKPLDIKEICSKLSKHKAFKLNFSKLIEKDDIIYLEPDLTVKPPKINKLDELNKSISNYIRKLPKSSFHLTLAYNNYEKLDISPIYKQNFNKLRKELMKNPLEMKLEKIWILKRNKITKKSWYRIKTINLR